MKILRIIARLNVGGPARHVVWLTKGLNDEEFTSILAAGTVPSGEEDMAYLAKENGVEPIFIEAMSRELSPKDIVSLFKIYSLIRREKPNIIHTHTAKAGTVGRSAAFLYRWFTPAALIGRPRRIAVVHTFHGHVFHSYYGRLKTSVFVLIEKLLARFVTDRIVVISSQQFNEIHSEVGIGSKEQFAVIPLGIDLAPFSARPNSADGIRGLLPVDSSTLLVGFVGRLTEIKNIPLFLQAARAYETADDPTLPKAHFVIVGDGHLRASLEAQSERLGIRNITFLGNREEIESVYAALDVVALTSLNEGTPLSLIEAMASGTPIISTMVGGVVDLLGTAREKMDGFFVCERGIGIDGGESETFVKGLIYLLKNERLREVLTTRGSEFVRENYSKDRLIADIRQLYRQLA